MARKLKRSLPRTIQCPVCDHFTFKEFASNEECVVCSWVNDGSVIELEDLRRPSTENDGRTLESARVSFQQLSGHKLLTLQNGYKLKSNQDKFLFYQFLCDLKDANIPFARNSYCDQCQWDEPFEAFRKAPNALGVVVYGSETNGFYIWSGILPEQTEAFQSTVIESASRRKIVLKSKFLGQSEVLGTSFVVIGYSGIGSITLVPFRPYIQPIDCHGQFHSNQSTDLA
jgi:hypothetical protein